MHEETQNQPIVTADSSGDADTSGKLTASLFVVVIALLLVLIYAIASAA